MKTLLTAALLAASISNSYAQVGAINGPPATGRSAAVLRFAIASDVHADAATLPQQACPESNNLGGLPVDVGRRTPAAVLASRKPTTNRSSLRSSNLRTKTN